MGDLRFSELISQLQTGSWWFDVRTASIKQTFSIRSISTHDGDLIQSLLTFYPDFSLSQLCSAMFKINCQSTLLYHSDYDIDIDNNL